MKFAWPSMLFLLLFIPLLVWWYFNVLRRRRAYIEQYGYGLIKNDGVAGMRRHIPALLFLTGVSILLFSLSRPQATVSLPKYEGTVILVFDVSGSMSADDVEPSRMEAAKAAAYEFVKDQPASIRIGVVAFSDGGLSVQAPNINREGTLATIERLVPRRGTSMGNGMLVALNTIAVDAGDPAFLNKTEIASPNNNNDEVPTVQGWYPSTVIVLFSDGENNDDRPDPMAVTDLAVDMGVRIYTVGVGSEAGTIINVDGMSIHTALNGELLNQIALEAGGNYYYAGDENELKQIYRDLQPTLSIRPEALELTSLLAGLSVLVILFAGGLSLLWFGRVL